MVIDLWQIAQKVFTTLGDHNAGRRAFNIISVVRAIERANTVFPAEVGGPMRQASLTFTAGSFEKLHDLTDTKDTYTVTRLYNATKRVMPRKVTPTELNQIRMQSTAADGMPRYYAMERHIEAGDQLAIRFMVWPPPSADYASGWTIEFTSPYILNATVGVDADIQITDLHFEALVATAAAEVLRLATADQLTAIGLDKQSLEKFEAWAAWLRELEKDSRERLKRAQPTQRENF